LFPAVASNGSAIFRRSVSKFDTGTFCPHWTDRIVRHLNPHDRRIFMAVAGQGNKARAANSPAISRPVLSRIIAELEQRRASGCSTA
jgi:hypothetical protein